MASIQHYNEIIHAFLSDNNFRTIPKNPTSYDHRTNQKALQQCDRIIDRKQIEFLTQKNPIPPTLNALLKLHKPDIPIRPVVNNRNSPTHKTARRLNTILNNRYNTINSNTLANEMVKPKINSHHRLLTLDIKDLYVNVPIQEMLNLTRTQLRIHKDKQNTHQIMTLLDNILTQNYFSSLARVYQPDKGVAMGSPILGTMAEVFLQQLENIIIKHLIDAKTLSFYTRYVDDFFLIYDSTRTNPDNILQYIDIIHSSIQFNPTIESNNYVNFLDLSITRGPTCLGISIFCKPTSTDTTINFLSNHLLEYKMAAYRFLIRRMLSLPLDKEQQYKEWQHILHTAHSNKIPQPY